MNDRDNHNNQIGNYRWIICSLIFFATTINYLDRAVISLLKGTLEEEFNWSETDYANIIIAFQISYALGLLIAGGIIDRIGTKLGYALSIFLWSVSAMAHAMAKNTFGFLFARTGLGLSEAGNFPSAIKTVAEWFPKKERALATGIFNSGTNIGAIIAPLSVPFIASTLGWKWAFILTGLTGFIVLIFWWKIYQKPQSHPKLSAEELNYINSDQGGGDVSISEENLLTSQKWTGLFSFKATWAFLIGKFLTDPIWWFYLFWLPAFLKAQYGMEGTSIALPVAVVYTMSAIGSIGGGWIPIKFMSLGWDILKARKFSMLLFSLFALPVFVVQWFGHINMWLAVLIIGIATAAHQAWSANIYNVVSDRFAKSSVASVIGIGGMGGAVGGILISRLAGQLFDHYKAMNQLETGYFIMFIICGTGYLLAWFIMHQILKKPDVNLQQHQVSN